MKKKIVSVLLALLLVVPLCPLNASAAYGSDWTLWSQKYSAKGGAMTSSACRIVAQAKMLKEAGILEDGKNPDSYGEWGHAHKNSFGNFFFGDSRPLTTYLDEQAPQRTCPTAYAKSVGKSITYIGEPKYLNGSDSAGEAKKIMGWLKDGYFVIVGFTRKFPGIDKYAGHEAYIMRDKSLSSGEVYISDSGSRLADKNRIKEYRKYNVSVTKYGKSLTVTDFDYALLYKTPQGPVVTVTEKGQVVDSITYNGIEVDAVYRPYDKSVNTDTKYNTVAFVKKFYKKVYGIKVFNLFKDKGGPKTTKGNGYFTPTDKPQIGDIVHFRSSTSSRWSIVQSVNGSKVDVIEQNSWHNKAKSQARIDRQYSVTDSNVTIYHYSKWGPDDGIVNAGRNEKSNGVYTFYGSADVTSVPTEVGLLIGTSSTASQMKVMGKDTSGMKSAKNLNMWYKVKESDLKANTTYYYIFYAKLPGRAAPVYSLAKKFTTSSIVTGTVTGVADGSSLRIRSGPSTSYKTLKRIPKWKTVTIDLSKSTEKWYYVTYDGTTGYSSKWYITLD